MRLRGVAGAVDDRDVPQDTDVLGVREARGGGDGDVHRQHGPGPPDSQEISDPASR